MTPPPPSTLALLAVAARRPGSRRLLGGLSTLLALGAVLTLGYPVATDAWSARQQAALRGQVASADAARDYAAYAGVALTSVSTGSPAAPAAGAPAAGAPAAARPPAVPPAAPGAQPARRVPVPEGAALTRLRIPKLGVDIVVVEGTTTRALRAGAGHYAGTPLPGEVGNVAIAGHRTTYRRPFYRLNELKPGDEVLLDTPLADHRYRVLPAFDGHANPWVVAPTDYGVVAVKTDQRWLTLTTCHPRGSARQRLVLRLVLVESVPRAAPA